MIIMYHEFKYRNGNKIKKTTSTMVCIGDNKKFTDMSKTVGLPLAIASILILNKQIKIRGIIRPIHQQIYDPVLEKLDRFDNTIFLIDEHRLFSYIYKMVLTRKKLISINVYTYWQVQIHILTKFQKI